MSASEKSDVDWVGVAKQGRAGLEAMSAVELMNIAAEEGIDTELDQGDVIELILKAAEMKDASKAEKKEFAKKTGISIALTLLKSNPKTTAGAVASTVVAVIAVVIWYFV